jgi:transcriptional regulator with XRE-family HTH domain
MDCRLRKFGDVDSPADVDPEQIIKDWVGAACTHERLSLAEIAAAVGTNPTDLDRFRDLESYRMPTLAHIRRLSEVTGHPIDVSLTRAIAELGTECRASYGTMSPLCVTPAVLHRPKDMARWLVKARRAFGSVLSIRDLAAHLNVSKEVVGTWERRPDVNAPNPQQIREIARLCHVRVPVVRFDLPKGRWVREPIEIPQAGTLAEEILWTGRALSHMVSTRTNKERNARMFFARFVTHGRADSYEVLAKRFRLTPGHVRQILERLLTALGKIAPRTECFDALMAACLMRRDEPADHHECRMKPFLGEGLTLAKAAEYGAVVLGKRLVLVNK